MEVSHNKVPEEADRGNSLRDKEEEEWRVTSSGFDLK